MKKQVLLTIAAVLAIGAKSQAANIVCGANKESVVGSGHYDTSIFWENMGSADYGGKFLLADGRVVSTKDFTPEIYEEVKKPTTLVLGYSYVENRLAIFISKVEPSDSNSLTTKVIAMASTDGGQQQMIIAEGMTLMCQVK